MISVIFPVHNEQDNLSVLHERLMVVTKGLPDYDFEFVFVDDCSEDATPDILEQMAETDHRVRTIRFSRNCGSHAAVTAGVHYCSGKAAIMLAADLQDPPELISEFLMEWKKGFKVVWGVRDKRKGESSFTIAASRVFYFLMNRLTNVSAPPTGADVFLIDRTVIEAFRKAPEKNTSVYMLIAWLGYPQTYIKYIKEARYAGTSKWTTARRLKLFFDSLISFSYAPLRFMSLVGSISALLGLLYGCVVVISALAGLPVEGWASLMIVVLLMGGFQMIMMGMLGEYLWRTYDETRGRPRYVIEKNTLVSGPAERDEENPQGNRSTD